MAHASACARVGWITDIHLNFVSPKARRNSMPGCGLATALSLPIYFVRNIVVLTRSAIPRSLLCTGEAGYGRSRLQEVLKVEC